jgi:aspartyl-tRNA synthetase
VRIHQRELLGAVLDDGSLHRGHARQVRSAVDAFDYGAAARLIALGIDRWAMIACRQTNIREVMAFPKTQSGSDLMLEAPSPAEPAQWAELGLRFIGLEATSRGEPD